MIRVEGFSFDFDESACATCNGHCCTGEPGYIWVTPKEMMDMAEHLGMDVESFKARYLEKVGYKYSVKEIKVEASHHCVFFDTKISGCSLYDVRPSQCRSFPFWDYFLKNPKKAGDECPGIIYHS